jgi:hypothetical protein
MKQAERRHILKMRTHEDALSEGNKKNDAKKIGRGRNTRIEAGEEKEDDNDGDIQRKERKEDEKNNTAKRIQERTRRKIENQWRMINYNYVEEAENKYR